jgi:anti-sigma regulatory factor (Ser/Thr protein kinase)
MFVRPGQSLSIQIQDPSQIGEARRSVIHSATRLGLDEEAAGKLGLVATELGTNLIKHAGGGEILLQTLEDSFEIMAVDKGPGISDWRRAFEDGFSTSGTPGTGLGAVARISSDYFAYGVAGRGSIVISRVAQRKVAESHFDLGAICVPIRGETECGDSWVVLHTPRGARAVVADGLGHGPAAAEASEAAIRIAREFSHLTPTDLLTRMHEALRATRGAAVAVADLDRELGTVRFAGVGNISASITGDGRTRQMVSHSGTAGLQIRRVQEFNYPWTTGSTLLMHSDGLGTHWSLDAYPGIEQQHPSVLGAALYRDYMRGRDDVTVVTLREKSGRR